jgi:hypothetical protein
MLKLWQRIVGLFAERNSLELVSYRAIYVYALKHGRIDELFFLQYCSGNTRLKQMKLLDCVCVELKTVSDVREIDAVYDATIGLLRDYKN